MAAPLPQPGDRCDRCGAQAWVMVAFIAAVLGFCKHHFEQHESALRSNRSADINDRRFELIMQERKKKA